MNALYPSDWTQYLYILLIAFRLLGTFLFMPAFSHRAIPGIFKLFTAMALALALSGLIRPHVPDLPLEVGVLMSAVLRETLIGLLMGFAAYVTFESVHLAAHFVASQIGLGAAGLIDPQHSSQTSALVPFQGWIGLMVFLIADMHHLWIRGFVESFALTKALSGSAFISAPFIQYYCTLVGKLFALSVQMALPFTLVILCCNVVIGILARLLPQMNMLLWSFPITILVGFGAFYLLAPEMIGFVENVLTDAAGNFFGFLSGISG